MQELIQQSLNQPGELEQIYRKSPAAFASAFNDLYPSLAGNPIADAWHHRLKYQPKNSFEWGKGKEMIVLLLIVAVSGCCLHFPVWFNWPAESFFEKYLSFIGFLPIAVYYFFKRQMTIAAFILPLAFFLITWCCVYFLHLPPISDMDVLRNIHVPILLWFIAGFVFVRNQLNNTTSTIQYLQHNGNWLIFSGLLAISIGLFTIISVILFNMIDIRLEMFYEKYLLRWVAGAFPVFTCYIILNNPSLVNRISPIIARIFAPIVLITLFGFLVSLFLNPSSIFKSRELLIIFNFVLFAVMAIILFSLTLRMENSINQSGKKILALLALLTCIANLLALSAIVYRLASYGFTPNRTAVLGANLLMFTHLSGICYELFISVRRNTSLELVENRIARWIPFYAAWVAIVVFLFPLIFSYV